MKIGITTLHPFFQCDENAEADMAMQNLARVYTCGGSMRSKGENSGSAGDTGAHAAAAPVNW